MQSLKVDVSVSPAVSTFERLSKRSFLINDFSRKSLACCQSIGPGSTVWPRVNEFAISSVRVVNRITPSQCGR